MKSNNNPTSNKINSTHKTSIPNINFPIVGVGASAGGLEAFIQVFSKMPVDTGMAFVLVQHLDPTHPSQSADILSRSTKLKVKEVEDGMCVKPNHIYIIPPNYNMEIQKGVLKLLVRDTAPGQNMTIDYFFHSLARSEKSRAIGIILSGTGTDGTAGLWAIKAEGGVTYAQAPSSAKYPGMPESAIDAGVVDLTLKTEDIVSELSRVLTHPYLASSLDSEFRDEGEKDDLFDVSGEDSIANNALYRLFALLRSTKRVDFSGYKKSTLMRRIHRRMMVKKKKDLVDYVNYLETHDEEVHALYDDILINVTDFFRDPKSFKSLAKHVFTPLLQDRPKERAIRVWVPGCSTGEEAYSIAISLLEFFDKTGKNYPIQIFATDISEHSIQKARIGLYSEASVKGLSKERLKQFFVKVDGGYQVNTTVRECCLFSRHDMTSDPPFAKLDFISCRNVMIYFGKALQQRVIPIFHYSLLPGGFLWLGSSESLGEFSRLFNLVEKADKIYSRSNVPTPMINFSSKHLQAMPEVSKAVAQTSKNNGDLQKDADNILLSRFAPPGVIVNSELEILQFRGRTTPFLEPAVGKPSLNLKKMARPELLASLRANMQSVKKENRAIERQGLHFESDGKHIALDIEVIPLNPKASDKEQTFLILFKETKTVESVSKKPGTNNIKLNQPKSETEKDKYISELMTELSEIKEYQQSLIEQYETSQEELTSANEELLSTNEELQSTNEEIETAKEELQSTNEELVTVNDELQIRNLDLSTLSSDLNNLLASIEVPVLIVGGDYRVRRFSPKAKSAFNLIPSDVGRPIRDIKPNFDLDLSFLISEVSESLNSKDVELKDFNGSWLRLQVRPYKTIENKIDGVIIFLTDIDELKKREERTKEAYVLADKANLAKDVFLATLSHELRTPLSSILTWAELIAEGKVDFEKAKQGAAIIEQNAKAQSQLIDDLLDISRIIVGKVAVDIQVIEPAHVVQAAIQSVQQLSEKKDIQIEFYPPSSNEVIRADPTRLQQIIWNLLTNAIKFSPKNSTIKIELLYVEEQGKRFANIKVSDQGKGIPPEFLPRIFNRFSQSDGTSTRVHGGLGLGLSIVKSLVELQSGSVKAENRTDGKGAVFTVMFPVITQQSAISKNEDKNKGRLSEEDNKKQLPKLDGLRILFVDDDESARLAIGIFLKSFGAQVKTVGSAQEALENFSKFRPDILVSDIAMPSEDGYSLIKKIRSLGESGGGNIPALALSAHTSEEETERSLAAGFQAHINKPVEPNVLARMILKMF